jgi:glycosyltransferase involved in cell wall biosynthesis
LLLRNADLVTSVSESIVSAHNEAYALGIGRYVRIPSGGDPHEGPGSAAVASTSYAAELRRRPLLASVGVMSWDWKVAGHVVCVRAVDELRRHHPDVMLLIAGDGAHRAIVEREVAALGLGNHVRLLGNVAPDRVLEAADVYVHMAMNEGCSLAIIEAMHAAKPIVAANAGGTPEVLSDGETALLIDAEPRQLAAAVQRLLADAAYARKLGARAREVALQKYTWSVVAEQYAATYRTLLSAGSTARFAKRAGRA